MTAEDCYPEPRGSRPVWLVTLADLALLLVGFFVFIEASRPLEREAVVAELHRRFAGPAAAVAPVAPDPMPVDTAAFQGFATGSADLPASPAALVAWARAVTRDPRITLTIAGTVDGTSGDVDPLSRSGAVLANDRARGVAVALVRAHAVRPDRVAIANASTDDRRRGAIVTLSFTGVRP